MHKAAKYRSFSAEKAAKEITSLGAANSSPRSSTVPAKYNG